MTEDDLIQWMKEQIVYYKFQKSVFFVAVLPKTGANIVDKSELMKKYRKIKIKEKENP